MCNEAFYLGTVPGLLGVEGIQPAASIAISIIPVVLSSIETPPLRARGPEDRARNVILNKEME